MKVEKKQDRCSLRSNKNHISNLHRYTNIMCRHPRAIIWFRSKGRNTGSDSQEIFEGGTLNVASRSGNRRLSSIFARGCCSAGCLTPAIKSLSRIFYLYLKQCKILTQFLHSYYLTIMEFFSLEIAKRTPPRLVSTVC